MLSLGYRYVYAIVMSIARLALCLRVSENPALILMHFTVELQSGDWPVISPHGCSCASSEPVTSSNMARFVECCLFYK